MKVLNICGLVIVCMASLVCGAIISRRNSDSSVHFGYKTDNGQSRTEDIMYNNTSNVSEKDNDVIKPVEYRGGYSFISADGYEYTVLYKANKNGFQPYVTARKIKNFESK